MPTVYYTDSSKADDTGDGLSAANAKKTLAAGQALCTVAGDELRSTTVAGGAEVLTGQVTFANRVIHKGWNADFSAPAMAVFDGNSAIASVVMWSGISSELRYIEVKNGTTRNLWINSNHSFGYKLISRNGAVGYRQAAQSTYLMECSALNGSGNGTNLQASGGAVVRCHLKGNSINIAAVNFNLVLNNAIEDGTTGIKCSGLASKVIGNVIDGASGDGVWVTADGNTVEWNRILNCGTGLQVASTAELTRNYNAYNGNGTARTIDAAAIDRLVTAPTDMATDGTVDTAGGDYTTDDAAEVRAVAITIGAE